MKKMLLFTIAFIFMSSSSALSFGHGVKEDGVNIEYYENGQILSESNYLNGELHGLSREYYENGQILSESNYINGELNGPSGEYYEDGQIQAEANYANGELIGVAKEYYVNGGVKNAASFSMDKMKIETYSISGKLSRRAVYKDGVIIDEYILDEQGNVISNGFYRTYYNSGALESEQSFKDGKRHGITKIYDEIGELVQTDDYKNGKLIGTKDIREEVGGTPGKILIILFVVICVLWFLFVKVILRNKPF